MAMTFDHVALQVPDIGAAIEWYTRTIPECRVLYQDETWGLVEAGGARLAFVLPDQHPGHVAWRVSAEELVELATRHAVTIREHRDGSRSFYLKAPGNQWLEIVAFPDR